MRLCPIELLTQSSVFVSFALSFICSCNFIQSFHILGALGEVWYECVPLFVHWLLTPPAPRSVFDNVSHNEVSALNIVL